MTSGPKSQYSHISFYRKLVTDRASRLEAFDRRRKTILSSSRIIPVLDVTTTFMSILFWLLIIGTATMILFAFRKTLVYSVICAALGSFIYFLAFRVERRMKQIEANLLHEYKYELDELSEDVTRANAEILSAWEDHNLKYPGYPPDWEERREKVKKRDGRCCTKCGWPKGYKRLARNLHVHHKVPLSNNGNNSLSNLATLCHICHGKEQGEGHKQITYHPRSGRTTRSRKHRL